MQSYSKGARGLAVLPREDCIFTNISTSLSLRRRQCGHHYAIRAGRNLPDKEFRYLRTVIVTAAVYRGFDQELAPHHLTFRHRAGVTPYTSTSNVLAECCVLDNQLQPPILCGPSRLGRVNPPNLPRAHLLPKLRCQFAEFLLLSSLKRLRIFILPTCVGLRYGPNGLKLSGFSWKQGIRDFREARPLLVPRLGGNDPPDFPRGSTYTLHRHVQQPARITFSVPTSHPSAGPEYFPDSPQLRHSPSPLGARHPAAVNGAPENLGVLRHGRSTRLKLIISRIAPSLTPSQPSTHP